MRLTSDGAYKEILAPLLLNGTRIYFTEIIDNANYLAEVSQLGGIVTRHPMPVAGATAAAASTFQDGIVLSSTWEGTSDGGLVIRAPATDVSRVISSLGVHAAAWSPDGQQLAFTRGSALMLSDASGNNVRELAKLPDVPFWPSWSPGGHRIRFSRHGGGLDQSLWEIGAAGGSARPVLPSGPHSHDACCGSWSADGRYFIYVVDTGLHSSLWVRREHFLPEFGRRSNEFVLADGPLDSWRAPLSSSNNHHIYAQGEQALGELERYNSEAHTFEKAYGGLRQIL